jgi:D-alanyl-D-alanine carboxypeptidase
MAAGRRFCPRNPVRTILVALGLAAAVIAGPALIAGPAQAQIGSDRYSSVVMEAASGRILIAANPDEQRHPASLTKMMTLYMVFEALRDRRISLGQQVPISAHAASMSPTKLGLVPGTRISVEEAILGLVTKSANDAAAALAEMLGGGEDRFGQMMTLRARALGMSRSVFRNASGLPDPDQWTTASDMALLGRHLVQDFPVEYRYFSTPSFRFHGRPVLSHDHMLQTYAGADGIKTGYTEASGFNLVTSAVRGNVRLIGVVLGAARAGERDLHMAALLDQGFGRMDVPVATAQAPRREFGLVPAAHAAVLATAATRARWSVQVGAFPSEPAARQAAATARRLSGSGDVRVERVPGKPVWRAQLIDLSDAEARGTCATLAKRRLACTVLRPEPGQYASR